MVSGYDLRINLSHFIGKSYEKEVMNKINEISKNIQDLMLGYFIQNKII